MSASPRPASGLAIRITAAALAAAAVALGVVAVGILIVARSTFEHLMVHAGSSALAAQDMFDQSVATIFVVATGVAAVVTAGLSIVLARRIARPLGHMRMLAHRISDGDYAVRIPQGGAVEVAAVAASFNQMAASLEDQERVRNDFIVNAAHELRTPLTNLQGYLEALRDGVVSPSREQFVSLREEVDRLVRLADSLDVLAGRQEVVSADGPIAADVSQILCAGAELARPSFESKAIAFGTNVPAGLRARVHPDRLAQVLANLLQNAARYTPRHGEVSLTAEARRGSVLMSIVNSGDGIPEADISRVFERFYRVDKSRDTGRGGAGIGLAIVRQLVEADGGRVGADSRPGRTRFWCHLPA